MNNAIFDEHKGVYRVNNPDGTFDTYTPTQYRELFGEVPLEEEEADTVIDASHKAEDITAEEGEMIAAPVDGEVITEVPTAEYRLLEPIPYTDEHGVEAGIAELGSVQVVPIELGDSWVEQGKAVKIEVVSETVTN